MAINREKYLNGNLRIAEDPEKVGISDTPPQSIAGKFGEIIAPTLTGTVQDLREGEDVSLKQLAGSAMEVGSVFVPAGWVYRGLSTGARALRAAKGIKKAAAGVKQTDTIGKISQLGQKTKQRLAKLGTQTKRGAQVGGVSGALAGGGRALGDEEVTPTQFAGEAALGATFGTAAGAALPLLGAPISLANAGTRATYGAMSRAAKTVNRQLNPEDADAARKVLAESYENSFVADKPAVNKKLDALVQQSRRKGGPNTKEGLLEELADEGIIPAVEGKLANMRDAIDEIGSRIAERARWRESVLMPVKKKIKITDIKKRARAEILDRTDVDTDRALRQLNNVFESLQTRYGNNLSAVDLNSISIRMNKSTNAFNKEQFVFDTQVAVGRAANESIGTLVGDNRIVKNLNSDMSRLFRLKDTASVFHNRVIDEGELARDLGRYTGIMMLAAPASGVAGAAASGLFGGAVTGGSLFIAALAGRQGAKIAAKIVRNVRFNPRVADKIRQSINKDEELKQKLLREATGEDKKVLRALFQGEDIPDSATRGNVSL